jgi:hypothetical protein
MFLEISLALLYIYDRYIIYMLLYNICHIFSIWKNARKLNWDRHRFCENLEATELFQTPKIGNLRILGILRTPPKFTSRNSRTVCYGSGRGVGDGPGVPTYCALKTKRAYIFVFVFLQHIHYAMYTFHIFTTLQNDTESINCLILERKYDIERKEQRYPSLEKQR